LLRAALWLALLIPSLPGATAAEPAGEPQVKAVFLFKFADFVQWPSEAFPDPEAPFVIGVLGRDPFGAYLEATVAGEKIAGRPIQIQRYRRVEEIRNCQMLFISRSETERLDTILSSLAARPILTVGETEGFCRKNGQIEFLTVGNKLRFRINNEAAGRSRLMISARLLRLAVEVIEQPGAR
jgi:hypothetical protein